MLRGKKIILGVCGSIAAYKSALLTRLLVKQGAEVRVIMTASASGFITPLTLSTLSKNPVLSEFANRITGEWNNHVDLGLWADALVIAPASANTIAKFANGICDNLLTAVYLSSRCPVYIAPAMDLDMYKHPSTQYNIDRIKSYGNILFDPEHGELASGLSGLGRMAEPEQIIKTLTSHFSGPLPLKGKKVLITAGPTFEPIDPVRFIGNHSTGKMGYAIADRMDALGAKVILVSGPSQQLANPIIQVEKVHCAREMYEHCRKYFSQSDIIVFAAAVSDYAPKEKATQKIKKKDQNLQLELVKTKDIAAELGKGKKPHQLTVGFALETENERSNALQKLKKKNFDLVVLNSLNDIGAGFFHDTNKVTIIDKDNNINEFELKSKLEVAKDIVEAIITRIK